MLTIAEVARLPAASRAMALNRCTPAVAPAEFQVVEYGEELSSVPRLAPSRRNCTPATPTLSAALAETLICVPMLLAPPVGAVSAIVGGVVSVDVGGAVESLIVTVAERGVPIV